MKTKPKIEFYLESETEEKWGIKVLGEETINLYLDYYNFNFYPKYTPYILRQWHKEGRKITFRFQKKK